MSRPKKIFVVTLFVLFSLSPTAPANAQSSLALQFTPALKVFVYSFAGLSPVVLERAEIEAARMLGPSRLQLDWTNCISRVLPSPCLSPQLSTDLIIRFLPKALPQASVKALGIASSSPDYATAFLFYDRILALRTEHRLLFAMLGRVLAHEITHLLLPHEGHSPFGLMRAQWSTDDLDVTNNTCLGLSARSVQFMRKEALRRVRAQGRLGNAVIAYRR